MYSIMACQLTIVIQMVTCNQLTLTLMKTSGRLLKHHDLHPR